MSLTYLTFSTMNLSASLFFFFGSCQAARTLQSGTCGVETAELNRDGSVWSTALTLANVPLTGGIVAEYDYSTFAASSLEATCTGEGGSFSRIESPFSYVCTSNLPINTPTRFVSYKSYPICASANCTADQLSQVANSVKVAIPQTLQDTLASINIGGLDIYTCALEDAEQAACRQENLAIVSDAEIQATFETGKQKSIDASLESNDSSSLLQTMDYGNFMTEYQEACEAAGHSYQELPDFRITCLHPITRDLLVNVLGAPVCIGKSCDAYTTADLEDEGLLATLSTELEERNLVSTCQIGSVNAPTPSPLSFSGTSQLLTGVAAAVAVGPSLAILHSF